MVMEWQQIAGPDIAAVATPIELKPLRSSTADKRKQAVLHLATSSASAVELSYQKGFLIERLNAFFGYNAIADIKLIHTTVKTKKHNPPPPAPLGLPEKQKIEAMTEKIADDSLKNALKNLGKGIFQRSKG